MLCLQYVYTLELRQSMCCHAPFIAVCIAAFLCASHALPLTRGALGGVCGAIPCVYVYVCVCVCVRSQANL
jgi:hypothetical protein